MVRPLTKERRISFRLAGPLLDALIEEAAAADRTIADVVRAALTDRQARRLAEQAASHG
jgi:hypothetical protein